MNKVPIEDRLEIQDLSARYAFHCDTRRYTEIAPLFTEDGVFDESIIGLPVCRSRDAIRELFAGSNESVGFVIHINSNHQITAFSGGVASGTAHLHAEGVFNELAFRIFGYYADDYAKIDGQWLFKSRRLLAITPPTGFHVTP